MPGKKPAATGSLVLSDRFLKAFTIVVGGGWILQLAASIYYVVEPATNTNLDFWLFQAILAATPLFFFGVAYWYVGRLSNIWSRICKALLYALAGMALQGLAGLGLSAASVELARHGTYFSWLHAQLLTDMTVLGVFFAILAYVRIRRTYRG